MNKRDFPLSSFPPEHSPRMPYERVVLPIWKTDRLGGRGVGEGKPVTLPENPFSFYFPLVLGALGVSHLIMNAVLRTIKIPKEHMNEEVLFLCMPFMCSSLIILLLVVLQKCLKMEYSCEHSC